MGRRGRRRIGGGVGSELCLVCRSRHEEGEPHRVEAMSGAQTGFLLSTARHPGYVGGRGAGKTVAGVLKLFAYVNAHPGARGVITCITIDDFPRTIEPAIMDLFGSAKGKLWEYREKARELVFPTLDALCWVRPSSEPDTGVGMTIAFFWMDEAGTQCDQYSPFRHLSAGLRQAGYPHQGWITTTPRIDYLWVKQLWQDHELPMTGKPVKAEAYPVFHARTIDNWKHGAPEVREELLREYEGTRWAAQELEGRFISIEGIALPELKEAIHYINPPAGTEFVKRVAGIDFGQAAPTAVILWAQDRANRLWAIDEFYKRGATDQEWLTWVADREIKKVRCDPAVSEEQLRAWRKRYGVNIVRSNAKEFDVRLKMYRNRLQNNALFITPACPNLWEELTNLRYYRGVRKEWQSDRWADGVQDHAFDAGAYSISEFDGGFIGRPEAPFSLIRR